MGIGMKHMRVFLSGSGDCAFSGVPNGILYRGNQPSNLPLTIRVPLRALLERL